MSNVAAGRLRHRIQLQSPLYTQDEITGDAVLTWVPEGNVWAAIEPVSAREFIAANTVQSKITGKIIIRYHRRIDATWRAVYRGVVYNLHGGLTDLNSGLEYMTWPTSTGVDDGV